MNIIGARLKETIRSITKAHKSRVAEKNREIERAKRDYMEAKKRGDKKGMEAAHARAEKARREGGTIRATDPLRKSSRSESYRIDRNRDGNMRSRDKVEISKRARQAQREAEIRAQKNREIERAKRDYIEAQKRGDKKGMEAAHARAEKARREGGTIRATDPLKQQSKSEAFRIDRNRDADLKASYRYKVKIKRSSRNHSIIEQKNREIERAKRDYIEAQKRGDKKGMEAAHARAEKARREGGTIRATDPLKEQSQVKPVRQANKSLADFKIAEYKKLTQLYAQAHVPGTKKQPTAAASKTQQAAMQKPGPGTSLADFKKYDYGQLLNRKASGATSVTSGPTCPPPAASQQRASGGTIGSVAWAFGEGVLQGTEKLGRDTLEGVQQLITHPLDTGQAVWEGTKSFVAKSAEVIAHPIESANAFHKSAIDAYNKFAQATPEERAKAIGNGLAETVGNILPVGRVSAIGKVSKLAKVTESAVPEGTPNRGKEPAKGTDKIPSDFADRAKLEGHFDKHGKEFGGLYKNADEYLEGAREVIKNGIKVKYEYKDEIRTGYVRFMGNNKDGKAKFEFVGTNNNGEITTYHTQSGKKFWKTINGENIPVINPAE